MTTVIHRSAARTRLAALALGSAVVLGLTACGSDSDEGGGSGSEQRGSGSE